MKAKDVKSITDRGRNDPVWFVENILGIEFWSKQRQIIESVRDNPRTAVRSCNGAGKSFCTASIVTWFLLTHHESIVLTTAPTARQVEEILWQEIARVKAKAKFPLGGELFKTKWDFGAKWFALGLSTTDANRFQGFHAEHILGVMDEACGIESPIYEAMDSVLTSSGSRLLLIGNPTEPEGEFFKAFSSPMYNKIHISAFHTPNFTNELGHKIGGLTTPDWVQARKDDWGEDSPAYSARVLGEFPDVTSSSMIPLSWVSKAVLVPSDLKKKPQTMGVDVGRFGDDSSEIYVRQGNMVAESKSFHKLDTQEVADEVEAMYRKYPDTELIAVDSVGVGAGVADALRRRGLPAIDVSSGEKAYQSTKFNNKRTEMWYRIRELFRLGEISLPNDEALIGELTTPKYTFDGAGRYVLETKEEMKRRGHKSPNKADALVYAFAYDGKFESLILSERAKAEKINRNTFDYLMKKAIKDQDEEGSGWLY